LFPPGLSGSTAHTLRLSCAREVVGIFVSVATAFASHDAIAALAAVSFDVAALFWFWLAAHSSAVLLACPGTVVVVVGGAVVVVGGAVVVVVLVVDPGAAVVVVVVGVFSAGTPAISTGRKRSSAV